MRRVTDDGGIYPATRESWKSHTVEGRASRISRFEIPTFGDRCPAVSVDLHAKEIAAPLHRDVAVVFAQLEGVGKPAPSDPPGSRDNTISPLCFANSPLPPLLAHSRSPDSANQATPPQSAARRHWLCPSISSTIRSAQLLLVSAQPGGNLCPLIFGSEPAGRSSHAD